MGQVMAEAHGLHSLTDAALRAGGGGGCAQRRAAATAVAASVEPAVDDAEQAAGAGALRVRFHIIRNACIENVGKYQSCMVSKLRIIWKQTVAKRSMS